MIYIYALICPVNGGPRYIGKCKNAVRRLAKHIAAAKSFETNHHCARWIRKLLAQGLRPTLIIVRELPDWSDWQNAESEAIAQYRAAGHDLTNMTSGGDGFHDVHPDVARRRDHAIKEFWSKPENQQRLRDRAAKLAESHRTPEAREMHKAQLTKFWAGDRERIIASMRTPEAVANRSNATKQRFSDPVEVAKFALRMKEVWSTPESRIVASERSIRAWSDPDKKQKRIDAILVRMAEPEARAKARAVILEIAARPEVSQKKAAATKAQWADPEMRKKREAAINHDKMSDSAKARWTDPEEREKILAQRKSPEHRFKLSQKAQARSTPEYCAMMAEKTRLSWEKRRRKKKSKF